MKEIVYMQVKQEEIEGLSDRVKEMMTSHDEEVERLNKVVEHYREDFEQEKQDMHRCVLIVNADNKQPALKFH